jgi:hypothetical protein
MDPIDPHQVVGEARQRKFEQPAVPFLPDAQAVEAFRRDLAGFLPKRGGEWHVAVPSVAKGSWIVMQAVRHKVPQFLG